MVEQKIRCQWSDKWNVNVRFVRFGSLLDDLTVVKKTLFAVMKVLPTISYFAQ